jgi:hypothetical protein
VRKVFALLFAFGSEGLVIPLGMLTPRLYYRKFWIVSMVKVDLRGWIL